MLRLRRGDDSLVVMPEAGASILGWTRRGVHLFRRPTAAAVLQADPREMACFPLIPYCNRIAWRRFDWRGQARALEANFGDHPHAIHGVGWQRPWRIEQVSADSVSLSLRHTPAGTAARAWPFAFSALLTYRLTDFGLAVEIAMTNLDVADVPAGIGLHPYFPRPPAAAISFHADGVWRNHDSLPAEHVPVPPAWRHANRRLVDGEPLDNCFTGWDGVAGLPALRIEADASFPCLQVFTPHSADFFCVEPVSHVPDAINRQDLPRTQSMTVLATGQTLCGTVLFAPTG